MGFIAFAALVIFASMNRETGGVLVALYAATFLNKRHCYWQRFLLLAFCWGAVQAALHWALGSSEHVLGLVGTFQYNLAFLPDAIFANVALLPLIVLVLWGYRRASALDRHYAWVAALYGLAIAVGGAWNESNRLILPIFPLVLPILLYNDGKQGA